jgi:hypothetical protein
MEVKLCLKGVDSWCEYQKTYLKIMTKHTLLACFSNESNEILEDVKLLEKSIHVLYTESK